MLVEEFYVIFVGWLFCITYMSIILFSGPIPSALSKLDKLATLVLDGISLTGIVGIFCKISLIHIDILTVSAGFLNICFIIVCSLLNFRFHTLRIRPNGQFDKDKFALKQFKWYEYSILHIYHIMGRVLTVLYFFSTCVVNDKRLSCECFECILFLNCTICDTKSISCVCMFVLFQAQSHLSLAN